MTLTLGHAPLSRAPAEANFRVDGPAHKLFFEPFPRRVRAIFGGLIVLDTLRGRLLHETGLLPQLYVPREDVLTDLLERSEHSTHCPFKGDARYWSVRAGESFVENAVWAYPEPGDETPWLRDYLAVYWRCMDAWFDEDEEIQGHLRDPYHRVDVRDTSRHVRVLAGDDTLADTRRAKLLSETGLPNRFYVPLEDVRRELLQPSAKHTVCPYKGTASYVTVALNERRLTDAAWCYPQPLENAIKVREHLCFHSESIVTEVDGVAVS